MQPFAENRFQRFSGRVCRPCFPTFSATLTVRVNRLTWPVSPFIRLFSFFARFVSENRFRCCKLFQRAWFPLFDGMPKSVDIVAIQTMRAQNIDTITTLCVSQFKCCIHRGCNT